MRGKQLCKVTAFLLIGILLFICVQSVFLPNWNIHNVGHTLAGYQALEENSVEAAFLGTSLVACGISPMKIYEDTGISTYNLGVDAQSIQTSYFLLKDFLKTQKPSVVFLDPSNLFYKEITLSFYRVVMDLLYPTDTGLEMAMEYKDLSGEGLLYGLVPLAAYHDRWDELKRTDFDPALKGTYYTMGYCMMPYTAPVNDAVMDVIRQNLEDMRTDGQAAEKAIIPGYAEDYLVKMLQLCRDQNIHLVIAKMPSFRSIMYDGWTEERAAAVTALAEKYGIEYLDMTAKTQVDETRDTMDGVHLNIRGAEKVSAFLGQYLLDTVPGIRRGENTQFESRMADYTQLRDIALLESETDFVSYLQYLAQNLDRWSVAVLGTGDFVHGLGESEFAAMQALGFEKAASARPHENYAAVLDQGTLLFETVSDHLINVNQGLSNKVYLTLTAASKYDVAVEEKSTSLALSNAGTYPGKQGMNFLVWDNATGLPLDCRNFDTTTVDKTYSGNGNQITGFLRAYESAVCFVG